MLFHADEPRLAEIGESVADDAERRSDDDAQFEHELKQAQVELASSPTDDLGQLAEELRARRRELAAAAAGRGARVVASGTCPVPYRAPTSDTKRYHEMAERFAAIERRQLTCAMHVHVSVESDDEGVAVLAGIALGCRCSPRSAPTRRTTTAGTPGTRGTAGSSGTSGRAPARRLPSPTAPIPRTVEALVASGAARDPGMIYFDARLSADYPTVEIRVCDVCPDVADAVTIAALCRALATSPRPAPSVRSCGWSWCAPPTGGRSVGHDRPVGGPPGHRRAAGRCLGRCRRAGRARRTGAGRSRRRPDGRGRPARDPRARDRRTTSTRGGR